MWPVPSCVFHSSSLDSMDCVLSQSLRLVGPRERTLFPADRHFAWGVVRWRHLPRPTRSLRLHIREEPRSPIHRQDAAVVGAITMTWFWSIPCVVPAFHSVFLVATLRGLLFVSMFHGGPSSTSGKTHWAHHRSGRSFNAVVVFIGATQDTLQSSGTVSDAFLDDVSVVTVPNDSSKSTECWRKVFGQMQASGCTRGRRRANYIARVVEPGTTEDFCRAHDVGAAFCPKGEQTGLFLAWPVIHARHLDLATRLIEELERLDIPFLRTLTGTRDFEPPSLACRADGTRPQLRDPPDFELGGCDKGGNISTWKSPSSCETKLNDSQVWFVSQTHFGLSSRFVHFAVMDLQEMYFERQFGVAGKCFWLETCWVWLPKLQTNTMPTRSFTTNHWFAIRIIGVLDSLHCGPRRLGIRGDAAFAQFFNEHKFVFHVHASSDMVIQTRSESCPETRNRQDRTKSDVLEDVHFHQQRRPQDFRCSLSAVHWENKAVWFGKWSLHSWWRTTI